jgi:outer membrane immunogenic protein
MRRRLRFLTFSMVLFAVGAADNARAQAIAGVRPPQAQVEISAGYSYMRSNDVISGAPVNLNGASFSAAYYVKNWLGLVGEVGLYRQGNVAASGFSLAVSSYQAGPRVRLRRHSHLIPFGQFLLGAGHAGGTLYTRSLGFGVSPLGTNNAFLFTAGGGADWRLSPRIGIRLIQAEYWHSQFLNVSGNRQDNLRLSSGVVFSFGEN